jgi:hypothetical protein
MDNNTSRLASLTSNVLETLVYVGLMVLLSAVPTWLLWNWLVPELFNGPTINLLQALGINLLLNILFKLPRSNVQS